MYKVQSKILLTEEWRDIYSTPHKRSALEFLEAASKARCRRETTGVFDPVSMTSTVYCGDDILEYRALEIN